MSAQVIALRKELEERFPDALPLRPGTVGGVPTGLAALDAVLPGAGLPRGRLSVWAPGGGATAVLGAACAAAVARGERAAWVDGAGTVLGETWPRGPLLLRPKGALEAMVCAEELLRSGGFALVVGTGLGEALAGEAVRLGRAAREGGGAFVALADVVPVAALRMESRILPDGYRWRLDPFGEPVEVESVTMEVRARAMGAAVRARFTLPVVQHESRLCSDPRLVDRRGAV